MLVATCSLACAGKRFESSALGGSDDTSPTLSSGTAPRDDQTVGADDADPGAESTLDEGSSHTASKPGTGDDGPNKEVKGPTPDTHPSDEPSDTESKLDAGAPAAPPTPETHTRSDAGPVSDAPNADAGSSVTFPPVYPSSPEAGAPATSSDECVEPSDDPCGCAAHRDRVCASFGRHLIHRYSFDGKGSVAVDSAGDADGTIVGTELDGSGILPLSNPVNYVGLPAGLISGLEDATLEAWVTWAGDGDWQRVFDFGGLSYWGEPQSYVFLTPRTRDAPRSFTLSFSTNDSDVAGYVRATRALPSMRPVHLAVVIEGGARRAVTYIDGVLEQQGAMNVALGVINDEYNRLGRSLFGDDPDFHGSFDEFRIYDTALGAEEVALSHERGPDAALDNAWR